MSNLAENSMTVRQEQEAAVLDAPRLWLVLARAYGSIAAYIESSFGDRGFGLSDFMVLEVLLHKGPLTISSIGEKVLLASASMTSAIDRLEQRGLVRRGASPCDRRVKLVELTCEGRTFAEQIYRQHVEDIDRITAGLSAEERRVLYAGLKKMGLAAKSARGAGRPLQIEVPGKTAGAAVGAIASATGVKEQNAIEQTGDRKVAASPVARDRKKGN